MTTDEFIYLHRTDDVRHLALKKCPEGVDLTAALAQIEGFQLARKKLPEWTEVEGIQYPPRLSMEQCSSSATARYKQTIIQRLLTDKETMADLTGGFGVDCSFLAHSFNKADYVECQAQLVDTAKHNFSILHLPHITCHHGDGVAFLHNILHYNLIYLDPARRDVHGRKTVHISDCTPDLSTLEEELVDKADWVMVKLSPMLDLSEALEKLHYVREIHVVSVKGECKELLLLLNKVYPEPLLIHCINMDSEAETDLSELFVFNPQDEKTVEIAFAEKPMAYLYEPHSAILKAGAFRSVASQYNLIKLHPNTHLYTSDQLVEDFPGRTFHIEEIYSFNKADIKHLTSEVKKANLTVRNFPDTVENLRKRLHLSDGGEVYLFATTLSDSRKVIIKTRKTNP